jgi:hypothetical protein
MGVESENMPVQAAGASVVGCLAYEPLEERQSVGQVLGVPLYTHDAFVLAALDGLNDTVGCRGGDAEATAGVIDGLMVEGVDKKVVPPRTLPRG